MPVNPSTWGQRQEDWKFQDNLGYMVNVRPKWTAQGDSRSENKNKPPGQKGPQVKTGPLKTCSSFPFLSCEEYSYSLNSWASCSLFQEGQPWNSDSLGFNSVLLPLHLCCHILNSAPREFLHSMWSRPYSTYHTVLPPKGYSSLTMAWRLHEGRDHSVSYLTF